MKRTNNRLNSKFLWRLLGVAVVMIFALPVAGAFAAYSPIDYFKFAYEPTVFSKTAIIGAETFSASIKSQGTCFLTPPSVSLATRYSYRFSAVNAVTGQELILNPLFSVTIEPFPQKIGESYVTSNEVLLKFPAESPAGSYTVIEEITNIEMKDPSLGWIPAPKPSKPPALIMPIAPTQPSAPIKPPAPAGSGGGGVEPSKPAEPTRLVKPAEPTRPPGPRREIGTVSYAPGEAIPEKPVIESKPVVNIEAAPLPITCQGTCASSQQSCPAGSTGQGKGNCGMMDSCRSCGFLGKSKCCSSVPRFCCAPISQTVSALSLSPAGLVGGGSAIGTVTLSKPASLDGQVVMLSASLGTAITLPANVKVKAGATVATFNIITKTVATPLTVTIKASIQSSQATAVLTVNPIPVLSALTLAPSTAEAGTSTVGTVTLTGPASNGGIVVGLSALKPAFGSDPNAYLTLPTSMMVPTGKTSGTFSIAIKKTAKPISITIRATLKNLTKSSVLIIKAKPPLTCTDSDNGKIYETKGVVKSADFSGNDNCEDGATLNEYYCLATPNAAGDMFDAVQYLCPNGCRDGACQAPKITPVSLTIAPTSLIGGESAVGTVTLNGPAPAGGQLINLSSSGPVSVPASMKVSAGASSGTFKISTSAVYAGMQAPISASANSSKQTAQLMVQPAPAYCPYSCRATGCNSNEIEMYQTNYQYKCQVYSEPYSCGWLRTCYRSVFPVCCKAK